jgi:hypothetical protein
MMEGTETEKGWIFKEEVRGDESRRDACATVFEGFRAEIKFSLLFDGVSGQVVGFRGLRDSGGL